MARIIHEPSAIERAVVQSSVKIFMINGPSRTSIAHLIKSTGFSKAQFYKHFENKQDLYAAILLENEQDFGSRISGMRKRESLSKLLEDFLLFRIEDIEKFRLLIEIEVELDESNNRCERYLNWKALNQQHISEFTEVVASHLPLSADREDAYAYYALAWAMARGFCSIAETDRFYNLVQDRRAFTKFLLKALQNLTNINLDKGGS